MTFSRRASFLLPLAAVVALATTACAHKVTIERRPDGVLHLECEDSLPNCLVAAEVACDRERYTVLRAYDQHDWAGGQPKPGSYNPSVELRKSVAYVRCGYNSSFGKELDAERKLDLCPIIPEGPKALPTPPAAPPPAPPPPAAPPPVAQPPVAPQSAPPPAAAPDPLQP